MNLLPSRRSTLSLAISLSLASAPVFAQQTATSGAAGDDRNEQEATNTLAPIEVTAGGEPGTTEGVDSYTTEAMGTATPLSLSVRETPQSVSVVTRQQIEDQNLDDISDVVKTVTGIHSREYDSSRNRFNARGFEIENLMIDGVPTSWRAGWTAGQTQRSMAMYDRVEVVRGATGLMAGFGNPAAAINMVRKRADSSELTGEVSVSGGRWDTYGATADVSTALNSSGTVRGRVVASHEQGDSYMDLLENKQSLLYGVIDADLTDATRLSLGVSYQDNAPTGSTWGGLPPWYADGSRTDWDRSKTTAADWTRWASTEMTYFTSVSHMLGNAWELEARYDRTETEGDQKLLYLGGRPDRETGTGMGASPARYDTDRVQDTFTLSGSGPFRLAGREHELALGYIHSNMDFESLQYARTPSDAVAPGDFNNWDGSYPEPVWGATNVNDARETTENSLYSVARFSLTDTVTAILGGRLANYEIEGRTWEGPFDYDHDSVFTPYGGLVVDLTDEISAYASYASIFNPQDETDASGDVLDPVRGDTYEVGVKGEFFDGRLNASLAVFRIEQENLADLVANEDDPTLSYHQAESRIESDGYEIDVAGQLAPGWEVGTGLSVFSARNEDGEEANIEFPRRSFKLFTKYRFQETLRPLTVGGGVNWFSEGYYRTTQGESLRQGAHSLVSLMARYEFTPEVSAQVNVENVTDEKYYNQYGFYSQHSYGAPRNVTASLKYAF